MATSTADSASCTGVGGGNRIWCCGRSTRPARSCSWIGQEQPYRSMDPRGGPVQQAHLFVAVLGASSYTYAEATADEQLASWIGAHVRAFEFYDGVPKLVVPDNTKTGVTKACRYDPDLNPTYQEMAMHYGIGVVPARPYKPRDKTCASYYTLFRFDSGQDRLGGATTAVPFYDCDIPERL